MKIFLPEVEIISGYFSVKMFTFSAVVRMPGKNDNG